MRKPRAPTHALFRSRGLASLAEKTAGTLRSARRRSRTAAHLFLFTLFMRCAKPPRRFTRISTRAARELLGDERLVRVKTAGIGAFCECLGQTISSLNFVEDGDWDQRRNALKMHPTVRKMFVEHLPYEQTNQYRTMKRNMLAGWYQGSYWCKTIEEIHRYFETLKRAYLSIRNEGYMTQKQLGQSANNEIMVLIDRTGTLLLGPSGHHRLSIVRLLGIKSIPVLVCGVHYQWAKACHARHGGGILGAIRKGLRELDCAEPVGPDRNLSP